MYNKAIQGTAEAESSSSLYIPSEIDIDTVKNRTFAKLDTERYGNMEDVEKYIFFHNELYLEVFNDSYGQSDLSYPNITGFFI